MELKQLQILVAISEYGSFSGAARALSTTQSNVSAHIARLESELEASLIERSTGRLTEEGEIVVTRARRILHEVEDIDADIHSLGDTVTGDCRIGVLGTTARCTMADASPFKFIDTSPAWRAHNNRRRCDIVIDATFD